MDRGVVEVETEFSDSDFKIEWDGIKSIHLETYFLILTSYKTRYYGRLQSGSESTINIVNYSQETELDFESIVMLIPLDKTFKDRFEDQLIFLGGGVYWNINTSVVIFA